MIDGRRELREKMEALGQIFHQLQRRGVLSNETLIELMKEKPHSLLIPGLTTELMARRLQTEFLQSLSPREKMIQREAQGVEITPQDEPRYTEEDLLRLLKKVKEEIPTKKLFSYWKSTTRGETPRRISFLRLLSSVQRA